MKISKIAIIGGGNLGTSIAKGLLKTGEYTYKDLLLSEIRLKRREALEKEGFLSTSDNKEAVKNADLVIISVKPQQTDEILEEIKESVQTNKPIVAYTVSGVELSHLEARLGNLPLFRIMPNTAIEIGESMTCIAYKNASDETRDMFFALFDKLGLTIHINESLMDAATVLGACGIAYALRFMRAATQGGIEIGFNAELSQLITAQTVKGAAELILQGGNHPEKEIDKVTTPQGITISGLNEMEHQGFSSALIKGLVTSFRKLDRE